MLSAPPLVRAQLSEALSLISSHDFPAKWPVRNWYHSSSRHHHADAYACRAVFAGSYHPACRG